MAIHKEFNNWLDKILKNIKKLPKAWVFNLYESEKTSYTVELVGTRFFQENNEDWACHEMFTSRTLFTNYLLSTHISHEQALQELVIFIESYLTEGANRDKLLETNAIGCGFVDGNLELLYINQTVKCKCEKETITIEKINSLSLLQLCSWIMIYTDYERIPFHEKLFDFQHGGLNPKKKELDYMCKYLYESLKCATDNEIE